MLTEEAGSGEGCVKILRVAWEEDWLEKVVIPLKIRCEVPSHLTRTRTMSYDLAQVVSPPWLASMWVDV